MPSKGATSDGVLELAKNGSRAAGHGSRLVTRSEAELRILQRNNGAVAGFSYGTNSTGFIYSGGNYTDLAIQGAVDTQARGINDAGQVVGDYETTDNGITSAFLYSGGKFTTFAYPGASNTVAYDLNSSGSQIVGFYQNGSGSPQGFTYAVATSTFQTVSVPGSTQTEILGINDAGEMVGDYSDASGTEHAFTDLNGDINTVTDPDGDQVFAVGINNGGQIAGFESSTNSGGGAVGSGTADAFIATPVCFVSGTRIETRRGSVAIENLHVGDVAVTGSGAWRPITWIGSRTLLPSKAAEPWNVHPVRISAGAFGPDLPVRDLFLSPGHPVLVGADETNEGGHLVPVMCLVNGTTVARVAVESVTYWHVELDAHDILLAEGLPAESYLDGGDRPFFTQGADHRLANPDFAVPGLAGRCRPVATDGPAVEAERRRLDAVFAMGLQAQCA